jgi:hypothetical protein
MGRFSKIKVFKFNNKIQKHNLTMTNQILIKINNNSLKVEYHNAENNWKAIMVLTTITNLEQWILKKIRRTNSMNTINPKQFLCLNLNKVYLIFKSSQL